MLSAASDDKMEEATVPQWKRDLILRRRAKQQQQQQQQEQLVIGGAAAAASSSVPLGGNSGGGGTGNGSEQQSSGITAVQQPNSPSGSVASAAGVDSSVDTVGPGGRTCSPSVMVQERTWTLRQEVDDSDSSASSEELQYGPGIVNKLKTRYLNLTLRESNIRTRPTILRKAASLENMLDEPSETENDKCRMYKTNGNTKVAPGHFQSNHRYHRSSHRNGIELKRARSVETISRFQSTTHHTNGTAERPKSMQIEEILITEPQQQEAVSPPGDNNGKKERFVNGRINRPKRIAPVMDAKEKPPIDVVKEKKRIFEAVPKLRTKPPQQTGVVADKVASFKMIIMNNKPPTKKPDSRKMRLPLKQHSIEGRVDLTPSPTEIWKSKVRTPEVTLPSPIPDMINEQEKSEKTSLSETPDLILHSSPIHSITSSKLSTSKFINEEIKHSNVNPKKPPVVRQVTSPTNVITLPPLVSSPPVILKSASLNSYKSTSPTPLSNKPPTSPAVHKPASTTNKPETQPLLSPREIEKNKINSAFNTVVIQEKSAVVEPAIALPKVTKRSVVAHEEQNSVVFNFVGKKDVPDHVDSTWSSRTVEKPKMPKPGEGGITLIPGFTMEESSTDEEEELIARPPSPCDVSFINDNCLIDGRSSLSKRSNKKQKGRIKFINEGPQIFEYPSESSFMTPEEPQSPVSQSPMGGHTIPSLSGSTLATYTPKATANPDEFQLGVTRTSSPPQAVASPTLDLPQELEETPINFSSGNNADILF